MRQKTGGFAEFLVKFMAYAEHTRLMKAPKKKVKELLDEIELPEVPTEQEVARVGKKVNEEGPEL